MVVGGVEGGERVGLVRRVGGGVGGVGGGRGGGMGRERGGGGGLGGCRGGMEGAKREREKCVCGLLCRLRGCDGGLGYRESGAYGAGAAGIEVRGSGRCPLLLLLLALLGGLLEELCGRGRGFLRCWGQSCEVGGVE